MNQYKAVALFLSLLAGSYAFAQNFGGNPGNIHWRQVNTSNARIIYPRGLDSAAFRAASIIDELAGKYGGTMGDKRNKIPVVLQPNNTLSNAYVQLAPWRSEFYLTPPQDPFDLGSLRWVDNLAIHEYRHVEQYSNYNVGLSKFFSILLGQQGRALANAAAVPDWFFEGDAVWNETVYSKQGRGRLPSNFIGYKSLLLQDKHYSFMKLRNGSLKNFIPNHYDLGYLLVAYGREKYGDDIWKKITIDAAAFKGLFYPLQKAVYRHTGVEYKRFVNNAMEWYRAKWQEEKTGEPAWMTAVEKNNVVNYRYPYPTEDGGVISLKSSYTQVPVFVLRKPDGSERKIGVRDISYDRYFSYRNGHIIYTSTRADIRWDNRDYSDIRVLDVSSGLVETITRHEKYFSPDISADGNRIAAVYADPSKASQLRILDRSGAVLKTASYNDSYFYSHPKFLNNNNDVLVAVRERGGEMGWMIWHTASNDWSWVLEPANRIVGFPVVKNDTLYYSGSAGNFDGLFMIDLNTKSSARLIAKYPTGIYQGFIDHGRIVASIFTAEGYRLGNFMPVSESNAGVLEDLYTRTTLSGKPDVLEIASKVYPTKKYSKFTNPFNFHSWQGELSDPNYTVSLLGENVLSSLLSEIYYTYNRVERSNKVGFTGTYGGSYVQPFIGVDQTWGREIRYNRDTTFLYNQFEGSAGLRVPMNFSFGKMYRSLLLSTSLHKQYYQWSDGISKKLLDNRNVDYYRLRASYSSQIQKAVRQIYPHFAQSYLADYRNAFNHYNAWQLLLSGNLYTPGFYRTHSIVLSASWHARDTLNEHSFALSFPFSRGYTAVNYPRMYQLGVNYHFPLLLPDWGFGHIVYFLRVRANAFYDFTQGKSLRTGLTRNFRSAGTEIYFDTKWWNQQPVTFGVRYSRLLDPEYSPPGRPAPATNPNVFEFILPVNLLPR